MTSSEYDQFRPPRPDRRGGRKDKGRKGSGWSRGADLMVPTVEVAKLDEHGYYGRPVVKAPPWSGPSASTCSSAAWLADLRCWGPELSSPAGRPCAETPVLPGWVPRRWAPLRWWRTSAVPERFLHMMRTFKVTSPMSVGSWILTGYSGLVGVAAVGEVDRMTGDRLPLGPLRPVLRTAEPMSGLGAGLMGAPLAAYTAVLLGDTAMPTWHAAHRDLPFVFVSSGEPGRGRPGAGHHTGERGGPGPQPGGAGVIGDVVATRLMEKRMDPVAAEPLHHGTPGNLMRWAERLAVAGGVGRRCSVGGAAGRGGSSPQRPASL